MDEIGVRALSEELLLKFEDFVGKYSESHISPQTWRYFYIFISCAYKVGQSLRPSLSMLAKMLRENGIDNPGDYAVIYAHGLYVLAVRDDRKVYGEFFNP